MSSRAHRQVIMHLFTRLRREGLPLGVGELLPALGALDGGWPIDDDGDLLELARLLFCHSTDQLRLLDRVWSEMRPAAPATPRTAVEPVDRAERADEERRHREHAREETIARAHTAARPEAPPPPDRLAAVPVFAPEREPAEADPPGLVHEWPLSRRELIYRWRFLRRPAPDGPADVLDERATVERAARLGFYVAPVYSRRVRNQAQLVLLVDQGGSMTPFHRFTRDIVETAVHDSGIVRVEVAYFRNLPPAERSRAQSAPPRALVFSDPYLTRRLALDELAADWGPDTSVLIVSDAGAARGYLRTERVERTLALLGQIQRRTALLAWLNPMPEERWAGSTAQLIAYAVPMLPLDTAGLTAAIEVVRGAPAHRNL